MSFSRNILIYKLTGNGVGVAGLGAWPGLCGGVGAYITRAQMGIDGEVPGPRPAAANALLGRCRRFNVYG